MTPTFSQKLQQAAINAQRKAEAAIKKERRQQDKLRQAGLRDRIPTPSGLSKQKLAQLVAAEKRMQKDPRAIALIDKAATQLQVQEVRDQLKIGKLPAPPLASVFDQKIEVAKTPVLKTVAQIRAEAKEQQGEGDTMTNHAPTVRVDSQPRGKRNKKP